jgi:hypothetical protein
MFCHPLMPRRRGVGDDGRLVYLVRLLHSSVVNVDEWPKIWIRASVVDEDVQTAETLQRALDGSSGVLSRANVRDQRMNTLDVAKFHQRACQVLIASRRDQYSATRRNDALGDGESDAAARARDERDSTL